MVAEANGFLSGKSRQVQDDLAREMQQASAQLAFERAAALRDRIKALAGRIKADASLLEDLIQRLDQDAQVQRIWSLYQEQGGA